MKTFILTSLLTLAFLSCTSTSKEDEMIKQYITDRMQLTIFDITNSTRLDTLKSEWQADDNTVYNLNKLTECANNLNKAGYNNIKITSDADYQIKELEKYYTTEYERLLKSQNNYEPFMAKADNWMKLWKEFKYYQDLTYSPKETFIPQFIGWKTSRTIKVGSTETVVEFYFNKYQTQITGHKKKEL